MDHPEERRTFPRTEINLPVQIDTGFHQIPGRMRNLTIEGVSFSLSRHLSAGTQVIVEILSEIKEIRSNAFKVEVLRCEIQDDEISPSFLISGKLMETNDAYLHDVLSMIFGRRT